MRLSEIILATSTVGTSRLPAMIDEMYRLSLKDYQHRAVSLVPALNTDVDTQVFQYPRAYRIFVIEDNNPIFYLSLGKFHDGFKVSTVAAKKQSQGRGLGVKIYLAVSDWLKMPLYSDSSQTPESRNAIWGKLIKTVPNRIVAYDQISKQDLADLDVYHDIDQEELEDPESTERKKTRLLKLLPA